VVPVKSTKQKINIKLVSASVPGQGYEIYCTVKCKQGCSLKLTWKKKKQKEEGRCVPYIYI